MRARSLPLRRRPARPSRRTERGGVAVMVGIMMSLIVLAASFAVDLGMQRVLRSDLQALADVAALDAARLLDGRTAAEIRAGDASHPSLDEVLADAVANNDTTIGDTPVLEGLLVKMKTDTLGAIVPVRDVDGDVIEVADDQIPDAVQVVADGEVGFVFSTSRGGASRASMANATTFACFRVGSFAAALRTGDSAVAGVFNEMVKDALGANLTAIGYDGLLNSSVALGDLSTQLGAGTIDELAALDSLNVSTLFAAYATVLSNDGKSAAAYQMDQLSKAVTSTLTVNLGKILTTGNGSAMAGTINAVDLLGSVTLGVKAVVSDGNNFLKTGVPWSVAGVGGGTIALKAIEAPQQACGPIGSTASTAQVELNLTSSKFNVGPNVNVAGLANFDMVDDVPSGGNSSTIRINASLAGATGTLVDATCGSGTDVDPESIEVDIDTRLLVIDAEMPFRLTASIGAVKSPSLLGDGVLTRLLSTVFTLTGAVTKITIDLDIRAVASSRLTVLPQEATEPTEYAVPPEDYTGVVSTGGGNPVRIEEPSVVLDLAGSSATINVSTLASGTQSTKVPLSDVKVDLAAVLSATQAAPRIADSLPAVLEEVNGALVPISELLGIRIGGADLLGVASPECGYPQLVG